MLAVAGLFQLMKGIWDKTQRESQGCCESICCCQTLSAQSYAVANISFFFLLIDETDHLNGNAVYRDGLSKLSERRAGGGILSVVSIWTRMKLQ